MVEVPALSQGILSDNSVTPDVEIKECVDNSNVRDKLWNAKKKKSDKPPFSKVGSLRKTTRIYHPGRRSPEKVVAADPTLVLEVAKLSDKVEDLTKNSKLYQEVQSKERTFELEKKLGQITDERLNYLEKLQLEQDQWKQQYLQTIKNLNEPRTSSNVLHTNAAHHSSIPSSHVTFPKDIYIDKQQLLQTPLPRKDIPQPSNTGQPGNGQFLRDILDQCNESTPNLKQYSRPGLNDIAPTQDLPRKPEMFSGIPQPSPILMKPTSSEAIAKEIEDDIERQKIAEHFPVSFSDYLPIKTSSPVTQVLAKTVPSSSLVAEFREKLRKLSETRVTLESNLATVQRKQKLNNFAVAALANQLKDDDLMLFCDESIKRYWIEKLVDEEITSNLIKVKKEVALEMKNKKAASKVDKKESGKGSKFKIYLDKNRVDKKLDKNAKKKKSDIPKKPIEVPEDENADESFVTHIYGKADYHPHRTTVHKPFMHISPVKSPRFRTKRALQAIPAQYVRSEKCQTSSSPIAVFNNYLAPTAISLGPPRVHENDPDPLVIPPAKQMVLTSQPPSPRRPLPKSPVPKFVEFAHPEELPDNGSLFEPVEEEQEPGKDVELVGEGERKPSPSKDVFPPVPQKPPQSPVDMDALMKQQLADDHVKRWVEQEMMARVLGQLYPPVVSQESQTVNMETDTLKGIIDDEIKQMITDHMRKIPKPKEPEPAPEEVAPGTPVLTPRSTPVPSIHEESVVVSHRIIRTPVPSPESSITELESTKSEHLSPPPSVASEHEVVEVQTPISTPMPSSPEVSIKVATEIPEEPSEASEATLTDPWEGKTPDEDLNLDRKPAHDFFPLAPDPLPSELVVRTVTPPPPKVVYYPSSSESSTTETRTEDKTISEGQLVVEHGEMIPKRKQPPLIPTDLENLMNQQTLKDATEIDFDLLSEGEFRPKAQKPIIPRQTRNLVLDDPTGIYSRPRKPTGKESPESQEEVSVGEVPIEKKRKFQKWRASKKTPPTSPPQVPSKLDNTLSVEDLQDSSIQSSLSSIGLAPNVIMVTSATPRPPVAPANVHQSNDRLEATQSDILLKDSLDDPFPGPRNQMTLTLPTIEPLSGASDTEEISIQEL